GDGVGQQWNAAVSAAIPPHQCVGLLEQYAGGGHRDQALSALGEAMRAQLVPALAIETEARATGLDIGFIDADDLGETLEAGKERRRIRPKIDQYGSGAAMLVDVIDPDGRVARQGAAHAAVRQERDR